VEGSDQPHTLITLLLVTEIKAEKKLGQIYGRRECPIQLPTSLLLYLYLQNIYFYLFYNSDENLLAEEQLAQWVGIAATLPHSLLAET